MDRKEFGPVRSALAVIALATITAFTSTTAGAHHSFAATYYTDREITLKGEVIQFMYRNPHAILQIMAPDENGKMHRWAVEWAATLVLDKDGVTRDVLKAGDIVIVKGSPSRNPADHRVRMKSIERPSDGWKWGGDFS